MTAGPSGSQVERWISLGTTVLAPVSVLGALLFYFGYVSSRSQYAYFGIDVDTIGLSTQAYVMRSPQPLLVPLLALTLAGAGLLTLHAAIRKRIGSAVRAGTGSTRDTRPAPAARVGRVARGTVTAGLLVLGAGVVLLFGYPYVRDWTLYHLVTPLLIAAGAALTG